MFKNLRGFLSSIPLSRNSLALIGLFVILAALPLTVLLVQYYEQDIRQRAERVENDYACNRPGQVQVGEDVGDCDARNSCTGNIYARYDHTEDTDGDGTADPNDPDDQPFCVNSDCSAPITCPTPTPTVVSTQDTCSGQANQTCSFSPCPAGYEAGSGQCTNNNPCCRLRVVSLTPTTPPSVTPPPTGGQACPYASLQARWQLSPSDPWAVSKSTPLANANQVRGAIFSNGTDQLANRSNLSVININGPIRSEGTSSNPFNVVPQADGTFTLSASCGNVTSNTASLTVTSAAAVTGAPTPTGAVLTCYVCRSNGWRILGGTGACPSSSPSSSPSTCQIGNDFGGCVLGPGMSAGGQCEAPTPPTSPTPPPPTGATTLNVAFKLQSIGPTAQPRRTTRQVEVKISNTQRQEVKRETIQATFQNGVYRGTLNLGTTFTTGSYTVRLKVGDTTLGKNVENITTITGGVANNLSEIELVSGDMNNDNRLNAVDYAYILGCLDIKRGTAEYNCPNRSIADVNDDDGVTTQDLSVLIFNFSNREGD